MPLFWWKKLRKLLKAIGILVREWTRFSDFFSGLIFVCVCVSVYLHIYISNQKLLVAMIVKYTKGLSYSLFQGRYFLKGGFLPTLNGTVGRWLLILHVNYAMVILKTLIMFLSFAPWLCPHGRKFCLLIWRVPFYLQISSLGSSKVYWPHCLAHGRLAS